ncbi:Mov34/MPN/PAD-1 family protein [Cohnella sp.]|uniref:Mov34/MPN/PAD-1 family protein n=1 Tax=Cohnella sp. TaxID=1883426 RepID=UPI0035692AF1
MGQITSVGLSQALENNLLSTCQRRLPYETCGVLYGTEYKSDGSGKVIVDGFIVIRNNSSSATNSFSFHPEDWIGVYFQAQKNQRNIVGFFHSHPQGTALPSIRDEQDSIPWRTYLIVSLTKGNKMIAAYQRSSPHQWVSLPILREL